jgi:hypothetical protein
LRLLSRCPRPSRQFIELAEQLLQLRGDVVVQRRRCHRLRASYPRVTENSVHGVRPFLDYRTDLMSVDLLRDVGRNDAHVSLVDEATLSIEYGHDGKVDAEVTYVPGLRILRDAADL